MSTLGRSLGNGTGFVVKKNDLFYLITNWHAVHGRSAETLQPLHSSMALPDQMTIVFHRKDALGSWVLAQFSLIRPNGQPGWLEHSRGHEIDVVAIPLDSLVSTEQIKYYDLDLALGDVDMVPECAMSASIIGFPRGKTSAGYFPIWKTGHVASDYDLDYGGTPCFLIDATVREGMSGSPVFLRSSNFKKKDGSRELLVGPPQVRFLGVYSGRIEELSEIGRVWKPETIHEIIDHGVTPPNPLSE